MVKTILFSALVLFAGLSFAHGAAGTGCGDSESTALRYALSDLSAQIRVQVASEFYRAVQQKNSGVDEHIYHTVTLTTDLPIYGYRAEYHQSGSRKCATVKFDEKSAALYREELETVLRELNDLSRKAMTDQPDSLRMSFCTQALNKYGQYEKLAAVLKYLGSKPPVPRHSRAELESSLAELQEISADIVQISSNLTRQLGPVRFKANPPRLTGSSAITPFASMLANQLQHAGGRLDSPNRLDCLYEPSSDPFRISCRLTDQAGNITGSAATLVAAKICDQLECYQSPAMKKLENAFGRNPGGGSFRGYFYSNYGSERLLLKEGDILRLYARLNAPAEMALLGFLPDEGQAYIIPLKSSRIEVENEQAILATLTVEPPFGNETLVLIAYKGKIRELLPPDYDPLKGVYRFKEPPDKILPQIRHRAGEDNSAYIEKALTFVTQENR